MKNKPANPIYLDVCVLSRPFDDQSYLRIRIETEATNLILSRVKNKEYELVVSPVHWEEIRAIPDIFERVDIEERLQALGTVSSVIKPSTKERAEELYRLKFGIADAAHVAFAE